MQNKLHIAFRGLDSSIALEACIRERAERLARWDERITSCHVTVQAPPRHGHGRPHDVRIQIRVRGEELNITRRGTPDRAHGDVYGAVRDAFHAAERRLAEHLSTGARVRRRSADRSSNAAPA